MMILKAWQDILQIKTTLLGPEDPNPPFQRSGSSWEIYPYTMQDDLLGGDGELKDWTALHIENDYLHCIVLPELGGHMYSLYDKVCGREVFYRNNVVKYGLVSVRGAWISGGIEFNFPMGHTYTTISPVSWEIGENDDEAWLTVGNICQLSRMQWTVKLALEPEIRRLNESITLQNRMPYKQRYWFWNNTAVPATDDLHLVYPARKALVAGGMVDYPIQADGLDISWYKNHSHADDIFTQDVIDDYFGCHYTEQDFGLVNVASHHDVTGRKFFTWGTADDGMIWEDLLTDSDGQYVEIQSGRFNTQSIWEFLPPQGMVQWQECWMPENGMDGWTFATQDVVLNFEVFDKALKIGALPTGPSEAAMLMLFVNGECVWQEDNLLIGPDKPFNTIIDMPASCTADSEFELSFFTDEIAMPLATYVHPPLYTRKPKIAETGEDKPATVKPEAECSAEELCARASDKMRELANPEARRLYNKALELDAGISAAHVGLGQLEFRSGKFAIALEHFKLAVERDRENDEARYLYALAAWRCEDLELAIQECNEVLRRNPMSLGAATLMMELEEEKSIIDDEFNENTDNPVVSWEMGFFGMAMASDNPESETEEEAIGRFSHWARNDIQLWLEEAWTQPKAMAITTIELARRLCQGAESFPMTHFTLAWLNEQIGNVAEAAAALHRGRQCPVDYCFPNRLEELQVLEYAVTRDADCWKSRYLLGNLYAGLHRQEEAMAQWRAALAIDSSFAVLNRNIALGALLWEKNPVESFAFYQAAIKCNPNDYRYYADLSAAIAAHPEAAGLTPGDTKAICAAQLEILRSAPVELQNKWQIAAPVAEALVGIGEFTEALETLTPYQFMPWEGATHMRSIYLNALMGRADVAIKAGDHAAALADYEAATQYPRNIGVGKYAKSQDAKYFYLAAQEAKILGLDDKCATYLTEAAEETQGGPSEAGAYKVLALRELGRDVEAVELEAKIKEWATGLLANDKHKAQGEAVLTLLVK